MGIFDNFSGGKNQRRTGHAYKAYRDQIAGSANTAQDRLRGGRDSALARYEPFEGIGESGIGANRLYGDAIGVHGGDARRAAFDIYQDDPFLDEANRDTENQLTNVFRRYNAGGLGDSGVSRLAVGRVAGENARRDIQNWLSRLQGFGDQGVARGLGVAGAQAGMDYGSARDIANIDTSLGNALAQSHLGHAEFDVANNNTGINNLFRLANLGIQGYSALTAPPKRS